MEYLLEVIRGGDGKRPKGKVRWALATLTVPQLERVRADAEERFEQRRSGRVLRDQEPTLVDEVQWLDQCFLPLTPGYRIQVQERGLPPWCASLVGFDHKAEGIYFWTVFGTERVKTCTVTIDQLVSPPLLRDPSGRALFNARPPRVPKKRTPALAGERSAA